MRNLSVMEFSLEGTTPEEQRRACSAEQRKQDKKISRIYRDRWSRGVSLPLPRYPIDDMLRNSPEGWRGVPVSDLFWPLCKAAMTLGYVSTKRQLHDACTVLSDGHDQYGEALVRIEIPDIDLSMERPPDWTAKLRILLDEEKMEMGWLVNLVAWAGRLSAAVGQGAFAFEVRSIYKSQPEIDAARLSKEVLNECRALVLVRGHAGPRRGQRTGAAEVPAARGKGVGVSRRLPAPRGGHR